MARSCPRFVEKELSEIACDLRWEADDRCWLGSSSSMSVAGRLRRCDILIILSVRGRD